MKLKLKQGPGLNENEDKKESNQSHSRDFASRKKGTSGSQQPKKIAHGHECFLSHSTKLSMIK